jgi:hypothetical protein
MELGAGGMVWSYGAVLVAGTQGSSAIGGCRGAGSVVFLRVGLVAIRAAMALVGEGAIFGRGRDLYSGDCGHGHAILGDGGPAQALWMESDVAGFCRVTRDGGGG